MNSILSDSLTELGLEENLGAFLATTLMQEEWDSAQLEELSLQGLEVLFYMLMEYQKDQSHYIQRALKQINYKRNHLSRPSEKRMRDLKDNYGLADKEFALSLRLERSLKAAIQRRVNELAANQMKEVGLGATDIPIILKATSTGILRVCWRREENLEA
ncbi:MAG: hypothetical protein WC777_02735 [Candidatus Gracilibacteria bacterium]